MRRKKVIIIKKRFFVIIGVIIAMIISGIILSSPKIRYPIKYKIQVEQMAQKYSIDQYLIYATIKAESNFNQDATSKKGAKGLMQLMDDTAIWCADRMQLGGFAIEKLYSPEVNIEIGTWYLAKLLKDYNNNYINAFAAYNAGNSNVRMWLEQQGTDELNIEKIPFGETKEYVKKMLKYYDEYKKTYSAEESSDE